MLFEWDDAKARSNLRKHGVTFHEAKSVFGDPRAVTFSDRHHGGKEARFLTFGVGAGNRLLVVVHTHRAARTRIISARKATRRERKIYERG